MVNVTWLDKLSEQRESFPLPSNYSDTWTLTLCLYVVKIDIDCMDPAEAKRFLPFKPFDQTSNQRLVYEQMIHPANRELFLKTVKEGKDEGWEVILDRMVRFSSFSSWIPCFATGDSILTPPVCPSLRPKYRKHQRKGVATILGLRCI